MTLTDEQKQALNDLLEAGESMEGELLWLESGRHTPGAAQAVSAGWSEAVSRVEELFHLDPGVPCEVCKGKGTSAAFERGENPPIGGILCSACSGMGWHPQQGFQVCPGCEGSQHWDGVDCNLCEAAGVVPLEGTAEVANEP